MARLLLLQREERRAIRRERLFLDRRNPLELYGDKELYERYRFDRGSILYITDLVKHQLNSTKRTHSLLPVQQVLIALRFYATGTFQIVCGDDVNVTKQTAHLALWKVTHGLLMHKQNFIKFPDDKMELDRVKNGFYKLANFPGVIGAIDGTHVRLQRPKNEYEFINRKYYPSINVQAICNHDGQFINAVAKWPGSSHDAFIWSQSEICSRFENGHYEDCFLLGDSAYPCKPWLMTPMRDPVSAAEVRYNSAQSRTRVSIEQTLGRWKRRFHSMHGEIHVSPNRACKFIIASMILHNIASKRNLPHFADEDNAEGVEIVNYDDSNGRQTGIEVRKHIINNYFS